jgi:deoxyadenosine/deoxycytidine kinase
MPPPRYIAIEGNIGAGKTTLAHLLADRLDARLVLEEFADNTFLPKFYADPERWAFPLELSFLADRYKQLKDFVATPDLFAQPVVTDYLFIKSKLFARINLDDSEFELFAKVFDVMQLHLPQPDVLLFLHAPVNTLQTHIRERGRDYEQAIADDYLARVSKMYDEYLGTLRSPVVMIDTSVFDFRTKSEDLDALLALISKELAPKRYFLEASGNR